MKLQLFILFFVLGVFGNFLWAQDPIEEHVFPPELVMKNQKAIALSPEQKDAIKKEVREAQREFTDLQWELEDEMETFLDLLSGERIDEENALTQLELILKKESEIKRTHLTLAIRIKNLLTPEQQEQLQEIKRQHKALHQVPPGQ